MPSTLSLSCSRKIYELLGDTYWTHESWVHCKFIDFVKSVQRDEFEVMETGFTTPWVRRGGAVFPAPSFSETIRLLPRIAEKKGWRDYVNRNEEGGHGMWDTLEDMTCFFVEAPTEEEGMAKVSEYLESLI